MHRFHKHYLGGQSNSEYALLLALVAVFIIFMLALLTGGLGNTYQNIVDVLDMNPAELTVEANSEPQATVAQPGSTSAPDQSTRTSSATTPADESTPVPPSSGNPVNRYSDQFDGRGNISWTDYYGSWAINNQYFTSSAVYSKIMGTNITFANYEFRANLQTVESRGGNIWDVTRVLFRVQDQRTFYAVMIKKDGVVELAVSRNGQWQGWLSATATRFNPLEDHVFLIRVVDSHIQVFIDGNRVVDYRDPNPILSGGIGFSNENSISRIDNVEVNSFAE